MSLRTGAIEEVARSIYRSREGSHQGNEEGLMILYSAWGEHVLDALLDYLEAHANEWEEQATGANLITNFDRIAALRLVDQEPAEAPRT